MSTVHPLFTALIDDAALFPPECASMADALAAHPHHKAAPYAGLVGRFLCPASRVGELIEVLAEDRRLAVGLIVDTGLPGLAEAQHLLGADHRLELEVVEIAPEPEEPLLAAVRAALAALPPVMAFVEIPRRPDWLAALDAVAAAGRGAKLRTGGRTAALFPTEHQLTSFITACTERDVPFKCTAGLHRAVRHRDANTGFEQHGFLNIALATHAAVIGAGRGAVDALIAERDGARLVEAFGQVTHHDAARTRALFVGYGSCSILEPVHDLSALGVL
ncbi:hypothetical protein BH20ACT5_BH20ACT5_13900 [soil metagenome]